MHPLYPLCLRSLPSVRSLPSLQQKQAFSVSFVPLVSAKCSANAKSASAFQCLDVKHEINLGVNSHLIHRVSLGVNSYLFHRVFMC
jgi:hypothetical protein